MSLSPGLTKRVLAEIENIERSVQVVKDALATLAREGEGDERPDVQDDRAGGL